MMKKKLISVVTAVVMVATIFSYGGAITVSAVESEETNVEMTGEELPNTADEGIKIADWKNWKDPDIQNYVKKFDTDGNGYLNLTECEAVSEFDVSGMSVYSLTEYLKRFPNIRYIDCSDTDVEALDLRYSPLIDGPEDIEFDELLGLNVHEDTVDSWTQKLGEITFENPTYEETIPSYDLAWRDEVDVSRVSNVQGGVLEGTKLTPNTSTGIMTYDYYIDAGHTAYITVTLRLTPVTYIDKNTTVNYTTSQAYTGSVVKPKVTVVHDGITLKSGTDYEVTYPKNAKYPGTYKGAIVIKGIGDYRGLIEKDFTINAPKPTVSITKVSTAKTSPYVQYKASVPGASKIVYKVMYRVGTGTTWTTASSGTTKTKLTVSKLANQKKYTVAVIATATVNGKAYVSKTAFKNVKGYAYSGTPIYTADEFKKIKTNSTKAKYYLANDITLPANTQIKGTFTGTLDGNGFAIKNYKYSASKWCEAGLFYYAKGATFKNIKMTGVSMSVKSNQGAYIAPLVKFAENCTFSNVKTYGKITASGTDSTYNGQGGFVIGGIAATATGGKFSSCANDVDITVTSRLKYGDVKVGGISSAVSGGSISSCSNTGTISVTGYSDYHFSVAGLVASNVKTVTSCKNSGKISVYYESKQNGYGSGGVAGICGTACRVTSCKNTGAISIKTAATAKPKSTYVAGIAGTIDSYGKTLPYIKKSNNKGTISFSGNITGGQYDGAAVAGVISSGVNVTECFNKGTVSSSTSADWSTVGGVCATSYGMTNNYNAGKITNKGKGFVGGLAGRIEGHGGNAVSYNYNSGAIKAIKVSGTGRSLHIGGIAGYVSSPYQKCTMKYNYFKSGTATKGYGISEVTNKYKAQSTKVIALTKAKCKKFSTKYWKYSSKLKRMVLKNNPE